VTAQHLDGGSDSADFALERIKIRSNVPADTSFFLYICWINFREVERDSHWGLSLSLFLWPIRRLIHRPVAWIPHIAAAGATEGRVPVVGSNHILTDVNNEAPRAQEPGREKAHQ
jgi:hypothetical protein